jgi:tripartite-type tricarboxylate transporter receptor subunit TctC
MRVTRRGFLPLAAGATGLFVARGASAQPYPSRPVRLVVGFAAGGGTDLVARMMAEWLSRHFAQQFVVENRTGMSGNLATETVLRSPPDGHTLLFTGSNSTIGTSLYRKLAFDFRRDSVPVAFVMRFPNLMVVPSSLPVRSVREFIDYARGYPGKLSLASSGIGTTLHLAGEMFSQMTRIEMIHIPYRGSAAAYPDLISGRVHVLFDNITSGLEMARSGKVRALGVTSAARWAPVAEIPAISETVAGFEAMVWYGIVAPTGTPPEVVAALNKAVSAALNDPALAARLAETGGLPASMTPQELSRFIDDDIERWRKVVNFAGITVD